MTITNAGVHREKKQEQKSTNLRGGGKKESTFPTQKRDAIVDTRFITLPCH